MTSAVLCAQIQSALHDRFDVRFSIDRGPAPETLSTGVPAIDNLTGGGVPRGRLTELFGAASSGRTSLSISILAQATAAQEYCAVIDATDAFDPVSAVECGVALERLLWVRCGGNAEHALKATDLIVQAGGFGLVFMDLADCTPQTARRISLASWFRLRHAVERTRTALVVLERELNAKSCSSLQLEMRRSGTGWSGQGFGKLLRGVSIEAENRKHNRARAACFDLPAVSLGTV
ncbi:MAG: DNA recombination/repair protein RecA [Acidobacteriota bacterium]|nr:DNA recombination/repair protein RecA [Acidobacteriota bacterium]